MSSEQEERLRQELKFLKDSLESDVISREEYERGRQRIEKKLNQIRGESRDYKEEGTEDREKSDEDNEGGKEGNEGYDEEHNREESEEREETDEKTEEDNGRDEEAEERREEDKEYNSGDEEKEEDEERLEEEKEETEETKDDEGSEKDDKDGEEEGEEAEEKREETQEGYYEELKENGKGHPKKSKKWIYGISVIIIVILFLFYVRRCSKQEEKPIEPTEPTEAAFECSSDSDCRQEGMLSICLNPNTKEARCESKEDTRTNLIIINDKYCKFCDTSGMETIIKEVFPNIKIRNVDYMTAEGKELADKLGVNALPAYIFDSNVSEAANFKDFSSALIKKGDKYIAANTASGAAYYFKRPLIKNKLDLYLLPGNNEKIEDAVQMVLEVFKGKIIFAKHLVTEEKQKENLEKELAINTYPTFLLNNQLKFRGVIPANTIKERICAVNPFEECSKELPKVIKG